MVVESRRDRKILKLLTYEVVDGKPVYYRGYREVLQGKKTPEEVMGSSLLQAKVIQSIVKYLFVKLPEGKYDILFNEVGVLAGQGHRSLDIGIFSKSALSSHILTPKYSPVAPVVAIEVDVKAELEDISFMEYVEGKVRDLFDAGTVKVIWILTKPKVIMVFEKGKEGKILRWEDEVDVLEEVKFRLSDLLRL